MIWVQQLHTQPLWWIEQLKIIFKKTSKQEKIWENSMYQKCSFGQSHNLQNQYRKSQQDKVKKKKNTKSQIQVCVWGTWRFAELLSDVKSVGEDWKCAHMHMMNWMSGRVAVRYMRLIMLMYSL
jgi:undecaprenyl pyrophosphate synthase